MFIANFFFGIIIVGIGVLIMKYNFQFTNLFSKNNFFERHLGSGSTYMVAQIFGVLVILVGFLVMFSLHDNVLNWMLSPITNFLEGVNG